MNEFSRCKECGRHYFAARDACPFCKLGLLDDPSQRLIEGHPQLYDAEICREGYFALVQQKSRNEQTWKDIVECGIACLLISVVICFVTAIIGVATEDFAKWYTNRWPPTASAEATSPETTGQTDERSLPPQPSAPLPPPRIYSPHSEPEIP